MRAWYWHAQAAREKQGHLDCEHRVGVSSGTSLVSPVLINELLEAERCDQVVRHSTSQNFIHEKGTKGMKYGRFVGVFSLLLLSSFYAWSQQTVLHTIHDGNV